MANQRVIWAFLLGFPTWFSPSANADHKERDEEEAVPEEQLRPLQRKFQPRRRAPSAFRPLSKDGSGLLPRGANTSFDDPVFPTLVWDLVLKQNVDRQGRVDYTSIDQKTVDRLVAAIASSSPQKTPTLYSSISSKKAYYLNAYNVFVCKYVLDHLAEMKLAELGHLPSAERFTVGNEELTLTEMERRMIAEFKDPRLHFGLNRAANGGPRVAREAFSSFRINAQLDRDVSTFVNDDENVDYDPKLNVVRVSRLFEWYRDDFGPEDAQIIAFINRYRQVKIRSTARLEYLEFDTHLNIQPNDPTRTDAGIR